jgi:hypothetical protein
LSSPLSSAIERIFSPLSRLLISTGISYGYAAELLKKTMLREAQAIIRDGDGRSTDSRLSIATGLHRKDIKRLKDELVNDHQSEDISITSQVIASWLGLPKGKNSKAPQPLRRKKTKSSELDFDDLVSSISKDVRSKAVLDELMARGVITVNDDDFLLLHPEKLTLNQDAASIAKYLGMNVHDHFSVAVNNLIDPKNPQLERCVHYHGLSETSVKQLHELASKKAMEVLIAVNEEAQKLMKDPANRGKERMNFGMYFFTGKK